MNREQIKKFVDLVKSKAQFKEYQRELGFNMAQFRHHIGKVAEYEKMLKEKKVSKKYISKALGSSTGGEAPRVPTISELRKEKERQLIERLSNESDKTDKVCEEDKDL